MEKNLAKHVLAKNSWESNLVADISKVDHLEGDKGRGLFLKKTGPGTQLRLLEGLPIFSDHFYVYGHLPKEEVVSVGNRLHCSSGENGVTKRIVSRISNLVRETLGSTYKNT
ncbi:unnamed protein product [Porites evermanni]|uniref:Uncharacterized protein n=1 Tax=Porites evermanni TaxID=104178 RepID=A0ABN8T070_9CNID|nr:unnamed protein product [Porites evermanni]